MGFSVAYETAELISPALQREMIAVTNELSSDRAWLSCEPPLLMNRGGILGGASKPNFSPHPDELAAAKAAGERDGTLSDLIQILCSVSSQFDVDWVISHDCSNGPLGCIRCGRCDPEVQDQCQVLSELAEEIGGCDLDLDDL